MANVPTGFISVDDALKLINAHSATNTTVDIRFLVTNVDYLQVSRNFTIKLMENQGGKDVPAGTTAVQVLTTLEREQLREAIKQAFKRVSGRELNLNVVPIHKKSTVVDPEKNPKGQVVMDTESKEDYNTNMGSGLVGY